jgi:hypothetical protein
MIIVVGVGSGRSNRGTTASQNTAHERTMTALCPRLFHFPRQGFDVPRQKNFVKSKVKVNRRAVGCASRDTTILEFLLGTTSECEILGRLGFSPTTILLEKSQMTSY